MTRQRITLIRANALMFSKGEVLADFERDLLREVHGRPDLRITTPAEWHVIDAAIEAMTAAPRQDLTDKGLAA